MLSFTCCSRSEIHMPLNISMATNPWQCLVSEAWSSLASWLRPSWVGTAPAQDQTLRLTRGSYTNRYLCKFISQSGCCRSLKKYVISNGGVPKTISFRKKVPRKISKKSELGWFPRQYCQCSSSRSMVHVSPPQKAAQHQMVQYKLS